MRTNSINENSFYTTPIIHFGFFASGIATVLVGQVLPILALRFRLEDDQSALFFTAQMAGSLIGNLINSRIPSGVGFMRRAVAGYFLMAAGVAGLNFEVWGLCLFAFVLNGIGIGITLPSVNMFVAETNPEKTNFSLNLLNFFWGVGAILCKPFVDYTGTATGVWATSMLLSGLLMLSAVGSFFIPERRNAIGESMESTAEAVPIWTTSTAWLFLAFGFVQVGFESAIGGWITTFANRLSGDDSVRFLSPTLGYFLFFVFGRGVSPLLSLRMRENSMIFVGLSILLCGVAAVVFSTSYGILLLGAIISGFGTSWIFPTNMSRFTRTFGPDSIGRATPLFLAGTLGSAFITYLIGYLSSANKDLRSGMLVLLASAVILIAIQVVLATKTRESRQGSG